MASLPGKREVSTGLIMTYVQTYVQEFKHLFLIQGHAKHTN